MNLIQAVELIRCSQINFQNVEKMVPLIKDHPIFQMAKMQLVEGLKLLDEE